MNLTTKDIRKAAFAVGFGLGMAKIVLEGITVVAEIALTRTFIHMAQNGDKFAQDICRKAEIEYETKVENKTESKIKCGFHC